MLGGVTLFQMSVTSKRTSGHCPLPVKLAPNTGGHGGGHRRTLAAETVRRCPLVSTGVRCRYPPLSAAILAADSGGQRGQRRTTATNTGGHRRTLSPTRTISAEHRRTLSATRTIITKHWRTPADMATNTGGHRRRTPADTGGQRKRQ